MSELFIQFKDESNNFCYIKLSNINGVFPFYKPSTTIRYSKIVLNSYEVVVIGECTQLMEYIKKVIKEVNQK